MKKIVMLLLFISGFFCQSLVDAHSGGLDAAGGHYNRKTGEYHYHQGSPRPQNNSTISKSNKIKRSQKAKADFLRGNPCPATGKISRSCPGYIIDHIVPLKRGGADSPHNMQWQTVKEAKEKDKRE